jgi:hypothetical protein
MSREFESFQLLSIAPDSVKGVLDACKAAHDDPGLRLTTFNGFPTAMLFRPTAEQPGSLHYMFFPAKARQEFHRHPGGRQILLVGDVDMHVHHSDAPLDANPLDDARMDVIPAGTFAAIRMPAEMWHCFETDDDSGSGVFAITFHDDDDVDPQAVDDDLMEEATVYWQG